LIDDPSDFFINESISLVRKWFLIAFIYCIAEWSELGAHTIFSDETLGNLSNLLDVIRSTSSDPAEEELF
jgi:hypothetical protein